jgi:hypothetical protein
MILVTGSLKCSDPNHWSLHFPNSKISPLARSTTFQDFLRTLTTPLTFRHFSLRDFRSCLTMKLYLLSPETQKPDWGPTTIVPQPFRNFPFALWDFTNWEFETLDSKITASSTSRTLKCQNVEMESTTIFP